MTRLTRLIGMLLLAAGAGSCAHAPAPPAEDRTPQAYTIGREDMLDVAVWHDPDLSRVVPVRPDGRISLPLIGELDVAGRTAEQVGAEITERLRPYIQQPRVVVIVREVNAPRIFVLGEVAKPGAYPLRGRMTLLQALALAGGPNEFAATSRIVLMRGPEPKRYEIDFTRLVKDERDFPLQSGDTVYVP